MNDDLSELDNFTSYITKLVGKVYHVTEQEIKESVDATQRKLER